MIAGLTPLAAVADTTYTGPTWTAKMGDMVAAKATPRTVESVTITGALDLGQTSFGTGGFIALGDYGLDRTIMGPHPNAASAAEGDRITIVNVVTGRPIATGLLDRVTIGTSMAINNKAAVVTANNAITGNNLPVIGIPSTWDSASVFHTGASGGFGLMPFGAFGSKTVAYNLVDVRLPATTGAGDEIKEPNRDDFDTAEEFEEAVKKFEELIAGIMAGIAFRPLSINTGNTIFKPGYDPVLNAGDPNWIDIPATDLTNPPSQLMLNNVTNISYTGGQAGARRCSHWDVNLKALTWTTAEMEALAAIYKNGGSLMAEFTLCCKVGEDVTTGSDNKWTLGLLNSVDVINNDNPDGTRVVEYKTTGSNNVPYILLATKEYGRDNNAFIVEAEKGSDKITTHIPKELIFSDKFDWNIVWLGLRPFVGTDLTRRCAHEGNACGGKGAIPGAMNVKFTVFEGVTPGKDWKVADAISALRMSIGAIAEDLAFDINGDGKITVADAQAILLLAIA
jgi:hypothetical protein